MKGYRLDQGKLKWSLMDWEAMEEVILVLMFGESKYGPDNYKHGLPREGVLNSMQRHLVALHKGEEIDKESQRHHAAHIICNAMMYLNNYSHDKFTDNVG